MAYYLDKYQELINYFKCRIYNKKYFIILKKISCPQIANDYII